MSKLDEWRKLCEGSNSFGADALREACDHIETLEARVNDMRLLKGFAYESIAKEAEAKVQELEARLAKAEADRDLLREWSDAHRAEVERLCAKLKAADHVCEAALSVASEDGIRYQLLAYNMGLAMIQRLNDWTRLRLMKTG